LVLPNPGTFGDPWQPMMIQLDLKLGSATDVIGLPMLSWQSVTKNLSSTPPMPTMVLNSQLITQMTSNLIKELGNSLARAVLPTHLFVFLIFH
jgi:hypothetical protein